MTEILTFAGQVTLAGRSFYAEFALEASREQLAGLLASLQMAAPEMARAAPAATARTGEAGQRITLADLNRATTSKAKWALIDRRFPWLFGDEPDTAKPPESRADIAKLGAGDGEQADDDWALIEPYLDSLVDDDGRLVRGAQSRVAEILGGTNAGHFREARVKPAVGRLKQWIEDEFLISTSTTSPDSDEENTETDGDAARVA